MLQIPANLVRGSNIRLLTVTAIMSACDQLRALEDTYAVPLNRHKEARHAPLARPSDERPAAEREEGQEEARRGKGDPQAEHDLDETTEAA